jgi:molybdate transport repressor ModE-like protein
MLAAQQERLAGTRPAVRTKVWFEAGGQHIFGEGLARLLEQLERLGTLQKAAGAEKMSYRFAWSLLRSAERHFGRPLTVRKAGGSGGGGSALSPDGRRLLTIFRSISRQVGSLADRRFAEFLAKGKGNG